MYCADRETGKLVPDPFLEKSVVPDSQLGNYYLEARVAHTRMASVFRCTDLQSGRKVALKILHADAQGDPVALGRFYREQEIGMKLNHPGVIQVISPGPEAGQPSMLMEWVHAKSLREILENEGRLSVERAVRIATEICSALEYIHSHGVVHRDLKPENIMVDVEDRIKLIDFGIADNGDARRLTFGELSQVMGTPDYISPEQLKGRHADSRSDLYALGVILYEMVTGETPFKGSNPFAVMADRLSRKPEPPRDIVPEIPSKLQAIIYRALERSPQRRYQTARSLASDLASVDCSEQSKRAERHSTADPGFVFYSVVTLIPLIVFLSLVFVAHQG
jgi:eukaryotic-like serine/threonine-protein kinase